MLRTTLLLATLTGLILGIGQWLGGSQGLLVALIFAIIMNFGSYSARIHPWKSGSRDYEPWPVSEPNV